MPVVDHTLAGGLLQIHRHHHRRGLDLVLDLVLELDLVLALDLVLGLDLVLALDLDKSWDSESEWSLAFWCCRLNCCRWLFAKCSKSHLNFRFLR